MVATGWTPLPVWQLFLRGFFEYHTGFPFSAINERQRNNRCANGSRRSADYLGFWMSV